MEVSSEANNSVAAVNTPTTIATTTTGTATITLPPPPSAALATATTTLNTTNTNQLLFSNDNLQSHPQKSPTILTNSYNISKTQHQTVDGANNNSTFCDNNREEESKVNNNCYNPIEDNINSTFDDVTQSEEQDNDQGAETKEEKAIKERIGEEELERDVKLTLDALLSNINADYISIVTATTSQSTIISSPNDSVTKIALITPVVVEEDPSLTKDIVTLRNLEITPPPQPIKELPSDDTPTTTATTTPDVHYSAESKSARKRKMERTHSETAEQSDESAGGRSKRQRKQTELFQVVESPRPKKQPKDVVEQPSSSRKKSMGSIKKVQSRIPRFQSQQGHKSDRKHLPTEPEKQVAERQSTERQRDLQDVICYERNDYLAIRNEENTFYLCQLTENVRVQRPYVKIRWLDTADNGKTYFITSHYDKIPQKSIIVPVLLRKLESGGAKSKLIFSIDEQTRDNIMDRLKRSLNVPTESFEE